MTRERKFKAWDKKNKKMHEFCLGAIITAIVSPEFVKYQNDGTKEFISSAYNRGIVTMEYEFLQGTGLKDKNGNMIFEGDYIQWDCYRGVIKWIEEKMKFEIINEYVDPESDRYFDQRHDKNYKLQRYFPAKVEIIGNIYSNPELLKWKRK